MALHTKTNFIIHSSLSHQCKQEEINNLAIKKLQQTFGLILSKKKNR